MNLILLSNPRKTVTKDFFIIILNQFNGLKMIQGVTKWATLMPKLLSDNMQGERGYKQRLIATAHSDSF